MAIKIINPIINHVEGGGEASFNIHYGLNPPEDTSMLWVETEKTPSRTDFGNQYLLDYNMPKLEKVLVAPAVAGVGKKVYIFAGKSGGTNSSSVYVFDTEKKTIEPLDITLADGGHVGSAVVGNKIYVFPDSTSVIIYDPETNEKTTLSGVMPSGKTARGVAVVGTKIYLFGGYSRINTIYCFDTENNTLSTMSATLTYTMYGMGVGVVGTKVYLFGGIAAGPLDCVQEYNTETDTIVNLTTQNGITFPQASNYMASCTIDSKIYLIGGCYSNTKRFSTIIVFDSETMTFQTLELHLKDGTYGIYAGVCGTKAYIAAGMNSSNQNTDEIREFSVFTDGADLEENVAHVVIAPSYNLITMEKDDMSFKLGTAGVYIGNADGKAERQKAYLYNGTEWEEI